MATKIRKSIQLSGNRLLTECTMLSTSVEQIISWVHLLLTRAQNDEHLSENHLLSIHQLTSVLMDFNMKLEMLDIDVQNLIENEYECISNTTKLSSKSAFDMSSTVSNAKNEVEVVIKEEALKTENSKIETTEPEQINVEIIKEALKTDENSKMETSESEQINMETINKLDDHEDDFKSEMCITDLPSQPKCEIDDDFTCFVTHVVNPWEIYVTPMEFTEMFEKLIPGMCEHYSDTFREFHNRQEILDSKCVYFAVKFEGVWSRAMINKISPNSDVINMFCIDVGRKVDVKTENIRRLHKDFMLFYPLAYRCRLFETESFFEDGYWTNDCLNYLNDICFKKSSAIVMDVTDSELIVHILYEKKILSTELIKRNLVKSPYMELKKSADELSPRENLESELNGFDDEDIGVDINIKFDGLDIRDEKLICKNYRGPPHKTCYKGDKCNKLHTAFNKDGYTVETEVIPEIADMNFSILIHSIANVIVTNVKDFKRVYVRILKIAAYTAENFTPEIEKFYKKYVQEMNEKFENMMQDINEKKFINSMIKFRGYPAIGEIVFAKDYDDNSWQRARVHSISNNTLEVFFIDSGVNKTVYLENIRKFDKKCVEPPCQAVLCLMTNIGQIENYKEKTAAKNLQNLVLNKKFQILVQNSASDMLYIVMIDENGEDITALLENENL